jgi:hypothetical protein
VAGLSSRVNGVVGWPSTGPNILPAAACGWPAHSTWPLLDRTATGPTTTAPGPYLRRWTDVLAENKRRLDFITSRLERDPSTGESLDWVRQNYAQFLPDSILAPGSAEATAVGPGSEPETATSAPLR